MALCSRHVLADTREDCLTSASAVSSAGAKVKKVCSRGTASTMSSCSLSVLGDPGSAATTCCFVGLTLPKRTPLIAAAGYLAECSRILRAADLSRLYSMWLMKAAAGQAPSANSLDMCFRFGPLSCHIAHQISASSSIVLLVHSGTLEERYSWDRRITEYQASIKAQQGARWRCRSRPGLQSPLPRLWHRRQAESYLRQESSAPII